MAPRKIRSRILVIPNNRGLRYGFARFRYTSVTKSVEVLDREVGITELMKCAKIHKSPALGGAS